MDKQDNRGQRDGRGGRDFNRGGRRDGRPNNRRGGGRPPRPSAEERLSRFLAFVLRHHPEEVGLTLDEQGAADLDALTQAIQSRPGFEDITRERIERLTTTGAAAQRFEIRENRIRARYGHSLAQEVRYEPAEPPEYLFHGTTPEAAQQALTEGLKPVDRQRVHLSIDTPAAREVGSRRCPNPVILRIDTATARQADCRFYEAGPTVWLADAIPPECITRAD